MLQTDSFEMTVLQSHGALGLFKCTERSTTLTWFLFFVSPESIDPGTHYIVLHAQLKV